MNTLCFVVDLIADTQWNIFKRCDLKLGCCEFDPRLYSHLGETLFNNIATE